MHKPSAKLKDIRPFNQLGPSHTHDKNYQKWLKTASNHLVIEVGCGAGLHPILWAQRNTGSSLIAMERTKTKFNSFKTRLHGHSLKNIHPVNDDALYWLPANIKANQVDEYYFLYPNPYPKEGQANKRWHRNPLFHYILETLKPNGLIHFASNEESYINECHLYCKDYWKLNLVNQTKIIDEDSYRYRTHFEKKYLRSGQTCRNLVFQKTDSSDL